MVKEKTLISMMEETRRIDPSEELSKRARIKSVEQYQQMYKESIRNPEKFWEEWAHELHWFKTWDKAAESDFKRAHVRWFVGGKLNASDNCLDRHLLTDRRTKTALIWVGESGETKTYTYEDLHREVCRFSRVLKRLRVRKGDRVAIYLPMIPELPIAMLACARLGAIHSVVFSGFSPDSLCERITDCGAEILITSNLALTMGKVLPLKRQADLALRRCSGVKHVVVVKRLEEPTEMTEGRDLTWDELMTQESEAQ